MLHVKALLCKLLWKKLIFTKSCFSFGKKLLYFTLFKEMVQKAFQKKPKKYLEKNFENLEKSWKNHGILLVSHSGNPVVTCWTWTSLESRQKTLSHHWRSARSWPQGQITFRRNWCTFPRGSTSRVKTAFLRLCTTLWVPYWSLDRGCETSRRSWQDCWKVGNSLLLILPCSLNRLTDLVLKQLVWWYFDCDIVKMKLSPVWNPVVIVEN